VIGHWLHSYWAATGGNILAMPFEFTVGVVFGIAIAKPFKKWWSRHFGAQADLDDIKKMTAEASEAACAARHIVSDLFTHHTGEEHIRAPVIVTDKE